jgi:alanyl-tRNA synthetase
VNKDRIQVEFRAIEVKARVCSWFYCSVFHGSQRLKKQEERMTDTRNEKVFTAADENALWYRQPWILERQALLREVLPAAGRTGGAARLGLVLEEGIFFPGGGGQPCDLGTIEGAPLLEVKEEGGRTLHFVNEADWKTVCPGEAVGRTVRCRVDAARRADYAQQHTGEHILAACLKNAINVEAVSVHFGEEYSTIETLAENISGVQLLAVQEAAGAVLARGAKVTCRWIDAHEIGRYPLRRAPEVRGRVQIVEIGETDVCACCGVHLADTSPLGLILISGAERIRSRVRLRFITGGRVAKAFYAMQGVLENLRGKLSCADADLARSVDALQEENHELKRWLGEARSRLFRHEAASLAEASCEFYPAPGLKARFMRAFLEGASTQELSDFTARCLETGAALVLVCGAGEHAPPKADRRVAWIAAHNLGGGAQTNLKTLLPPLLSAAGAKGGGQAERFQGSCLDMNSYRGLAEALARAIGIRGAIR